MKHFPVTASLARQRPSAHRRQVPDDPQPLGIGFRKTNPGFLAAVNRALANMNRDGTYARRRTRGCALTTSRYSVITPHPEEHAPAGVRRMGSVVMVLPCFETPCFAPLLAHEDFLR